MRVISHARPTIACNHDEIFKSLVAPVALRHLRRVLEEDQITIRFENGYGVTIFQTAPEKQEEVFEMLVLRFYGPDINDYQMAQYAPIPELNHGNFDEILNLCKQVALLPPSRAGTSSPSR
jgi:hypothetical protein